VAIATATTYLAIDSSSLTAMPPWLPRATTAWVVSSAVIIGIAAGASLIDAAWRIKYSSKHDHVARSVAEYGFPLWYQLARLAPNENVRP
jgi:hypothetical protein